MIIPAPKKTLAWLRLPERNPFRHPLSWLVLLALVSIAAGVFFGARLALNLASPHGPRLGGDVGDGSEADYSQWPFGAFLAPINPDFIEAAESDVLNPTATVGNATPVPTVLIGVPTEIPTLPPVTAQPTEVDTAIVEPTITPSLTPTATRTPVPQQAPVVIPPSPTSTPSGASSVQPSATPVTRPNEPTAPPPSAPPPPTSTSLPPTSTSRPVSSPTPVTPTNTATPVTPTKTATPGPSPTPSPTLTPTPPTVGFSASTYTAVEADGQATLTVQLSSAYHLAVSVSYRVVTASSTATRGSDFTLADGTLSFNIGETEKQIRFALSQDNLNEDTEQVVIVLTPVSNAVIGNLETATLLITDSDPPPTVHFATSTASFGEGAGTASFSVELNQESDLAVAVPYTISGSAIYGSLSPIAGDHTLRSGVVIISPGATSARVSFGLVPDRIDEDDEQVVVTLGRPINADLVSPTTQTITIVDDDTAGLVLSRTGLSLVEGEQGTYTVRLNSQPTENVTVRLQADAQTRTDRSTLIFTPSTWDSAQTVTVTAFDDFVDEVSPHTGLVAHVVSSSDPFYNSLPAAQRPTVTVAITDNDVAGVTVTPANLTMSESPAALNHTQTYIVALTSEPTDQVTVSVLPDAQATVSPAALVFDASNWRGPLLVTVTAVDDDFDEAALHAGLITHTVVSADPFYAALTASQLPTVTLAIVDNDTAGIAVTPGVLALSEGGPTTGTYTVTLTSRPVQPVTVTLTITDGQISRAPTTLVFGSDATSWKTPQTVTVTANNDNIDEGPNTSAGAMLRLVSHTAASTDVNYGGLTGPTKTVAITDDDTAGLTVGPTDLTLSETPTALDHTRTYTVALTSEPTGPVTVNVLSDAQAAASPAVLSFTPANWSTVQTVTVTAANDDIDELSPHTGLITHTASSVDLFYNSLSAGQRPGVSLRIADDDIAGLTVLPASLALSEVVTAANHTRTYTVALTSEPTDLVSVSVVTDTNASAGPAVLTFDASNWDVSQTVTVTATDDAIDEDGDGNLSPHLGLIRHTVSSADPFYAALTASALPTVTLSIEDNDTVGVTVGPASLTLSEAVTATNHTGTYTVALTSEPTGLVSVSVVTDTQAAASPTVLSFTPANWSTAQTVTVTATNDDIDELSPHTGLLTHTVSSADPFYAALAASVLPTVTLTIDDDDTAGVSVGPASLGLSEEPTALEHTGTYTLALTSQPTATVTVNVLPDVEATTSPTVLSFTPANWATAQTVTVTATDDAIDEDGDGNLTPHTGLITHTLSSADPGYAGLPPAALPTVTLAITDNDTFGLTLSPGTLAVSEGGATAGTYTVTLDSRPTQPVNVTLTITDPGVHMSLSTTSLVFGSSPLSWQTPQTVTVTAVDDAIDEGPDSIAVARSISHTVASADANYNGTVSAEKLVAITDNDTAAILIDAPATTVIEGGSITYTVRLASEPLGPVTIDLTDSSAEVAAVPASVSFTAANWMTPTVVTVSALDNVLVDADRSVTLTHSVSVSGDPIYTALAPADVTLTVANNDVAGLIFSAPLSITEGLSGDYEVALSAMPTADVTVTLSPTPELTSSQATLLFTPGTWDLTQTVTLTASGNLIAEGARAASVTHSLSSTDLDFAGAGPFNYALTVLDDDVAGVTITPISLTLGEAAGLTDGSFDVALTSEPTADVTVTLTHDAQVTLSPAALVFTAANYSQTQTVLVSAVNDAIVEAPLHTGTISVTGTGADSVYARAWPSYSVGIADNDVAGVAVSLPASSITTESGGAITFTIRLLSEPTAPVTVSVTTSDPGEGSVSALGPQVLPLVFDKNTWNVAATVVVTGQDDLLSDGQQAYSIQIADAVSADPYYAGLPPERSVLNLANNDNEPASASVGDSVAVVEGDAGQRLASFPVQLERAALVTTTVSYTTYDVTASGGDDYAVATGVITFAPGVTDGVSILVPVYGDTSFEPNEYFGVRLTGAVASGDLTGIKDATGFAQISNDDPAPATPSVAFEQTDLVVGEGAGVVTVTVQLDQALTSGSGSVAYSTLLVPPGAGTATEPADFTATSGTLVFNTGQLTATFTLTITQDAVAEAARLETVQLELSSSSGLTLAAPSKMTVTIEDDDSDPALAQPSFTATGGPTVPLSNGYYFTGEPQGFSYTVFSLPCSWPVTRALTFELWSPAMHSTSSLDAPASAALQQDTVFELYDLGTASLGQSLTPAPGSSAGGVITFTPSPAVEDWQVFQVISNPMPCGRYVLRSAALGDNENYWSVRAGYADDADLSTPLKTDTGVAGSAERLTTGALQTTFAHNAANTTSTSWFYVAPGTAELRLGNFDLNDSASTLRYYEPGAPYDPTGASGGLLANPSADGAWAENIISAPKAGWWRAVVFTSAAQNTYILDARGDGLALPMQYAAPLIPALEMTLEASTTTPAVGAPFTLTLSAGSSGEATALSPALTLALPSQLAFDGDPCGATAGCSWSAAGTLTLQLTQLAPGDTVSLSVLVKTVAGPAGSAPVGLSADYTDVTGNLFRSGAGVVIQAP